MHAKQLLLAILSFMSTVNGAIYKGNIEVYISADCDVADLKRRLVSVLQGLLLRRLPTTPIANKWTKLGPCIDFVVLLRLCCNLMKHLLDLAMEATDNERGARGSGTDPEMDSRMDEEFNWHKLNGIKLRNCKAKVADGEFMLRMIMLAVVLEPIRWLARWIIGQSGEMYRRSAVCAGLAQATCDCTSPFVAVLQYYSRLLRGHGARCTSGVGLAECEL